MSVKQIVNPSYVCKFVDYQEEVWGNADAIQLSDVVTGGAVEQETIVKACWDSNALYVRFECVDDYYVSDFKNRNDPLYEQDVCEIFIDDTGNCKEYVEIVVSPNNVVFDVWVSHDKEEDPLAFTLDHEWETKGLVTSVDAVGDKRIYTYTIPFSNFKRKPSNDSEWRINFFRIDDDRSGTRHYQAWSPTGMVNYHVPDLFGTIRFVGLAETH